MVALHEADRGAGGRRPQVALSWPAGDGHRARGRPSEQRRPRARPPRAGALARIGSATRVVRRLRAGDRPARRSSSSCRSGSSSVTRSGRRSTTPSSTTGRSTTTTTSSASRVRLDDVGDALGRGRWRRRSRSGSRSRSPTGCRATCPRRLRTPLLVLVIVPFWTSYLLRVYSWLTILGEQGRAEPVPAVDRDHEPPARRLPVRPAGRDPRARLPLLPVRGADAVLVDRAVRLEPAARRDGPRRVAADRRSAASSCRRSGPGSSPRSSSCSSRSSAST